MLENWDKLIEDKQTNNAEIIPEYTTTTKKSYKDIVANKNFIHIGNGEGKNSGISYNTEKIKSIIMTNEQDILVKEAINEKSYKR